MLRNGELYIDFLYFFFSDLLLRISYWIWNVLLWNAVEGNVLVD